MKRMFVIGGNRQFGLLTGLIALIGVLVLIAILVLAAFTALFVLIPAGLLFAVWRLFAGRKPRTGPKKAQSEEGVIDVEYTEVIDKEHKLLK